MQLYSNTKKKNLSKSIEKAKAIYYNKNGLKDKEIKTIIKNNIKYKEKEKEREKEKEKEKQQLNQNNKEKNNNEQYINKKRLKRIEDKVENELLYKICNY